MINENRARKVIISPELILDLLIKEMRLPVDAELVSVYFDYSSKRLYVVIKSDTYDASEEDEIPLLSGLG